jgi:16S rRNA G527 N7-methylase RsmG
VFRAVSPLTRRFLVSSGLAHRSPLIVAYKGRRERLEEELAGVRPYFGGVKLLSVAVPFLEEERTLVILRSR